MDYKPDAVTHEGVPKGITATTVFEANVDFNSPYFRIPALVITHSGTLVAAAEARYTGESDFGRIAIAVARSVDSGKTWQHKQIVLVNERSSLYARVMCPMFVYDAITGRLYLFAAHLSDHILWYSKPDKSGWDCCYTYSDDEGVTWADPISIAAVGDRYPKRGIFLPGIGAGIQMHNGVLLLPVQVALPAKEPYPCSSGIVYSTDHGRTWVMSAALIDEMTSECTVVEYSDHRLLLNARIENKAEDKHKRALFSTFDLGSNWTALPNNATTSPHRLVQYNRCHASTLKLTLAGYTKLLYSAPISTSTDSRHGRANLGVMLSSDGGESWQLLGIVYPPASNGYSCLAYHESSLYNLVEPSGDIVLLDISRLLPLMSGASKH